MVSLLGFTGLPKLCSAVLKKKTWKKTKGFALWLHIVSVVLVKIIWLAVKPEAYRAPGVLCSLCSLLVIQLWLYLAWMEHASDDNPWSSCAWGFDLKHSICKISYFLVSWRQIHPWTGGRNEPFSFIYIEMSQQSTINYTQLHMQYIFKLTTIQWQ